MVYTHAMGMTFWREFDRATQYNSNFMSLAFGAGGFDIQDDFRAARVAETYPTSFLQKFTPRRSLWVQIADVQTGVIAARLGNDPAHLQGAFEDFGQGILVDTDPQRVADQNWIHMMDGQVGALMVGYHRWHASIRIIQLLKIGDVAWWEELDKWLGLGWGVQSVSRAQQQPVANPGIAKSDLDDLRAAWLPLTAEQRDQQYDLTPEAVGYHPSPKQPVL